MKVDCNLCQIQESVANTITTKSQLGLKLHALGPCTIICCYVKDQQLGQLTVETFEQIRQILKNTGHVLPCADGDVPVSVAVRSIKRTPDGRSVTGVQARHCLMSGDEHPVMIVPNGATQPGGVYYCFVHRGAARQGQHPAVKVRLTSISTDDWQSHIRSAAKIDAVLEGPELEDLEKDGRLVSQEQLHSVATDEAIRAKLRHCDLRELIATVDSSPSRDAALAAAMRNPHFAQFCEQILDIVSPV